MCRQWNSEKECYEEGSYEEGVFIPYDEESFQEPIDDIIDDIPDDAPIGSDALRSVWFKD